MTCEFLKYLSAWDAYAKDFSGSNEIPYRHFTLSKETLEGIYMTGMYNVYTMDLTLILI